MWGDIEVVFRLKLIIHVLVYNYVTEQHVPGGFFVWYCVGGLYNGVSNTIWYLCDSSRLKIMSRVCFNTVYFISLKSPLSNI